jgi:hypothetical protein
MARGSFAMLPSMDAANSEETPFTSPLHEPYIPGGFELISADSYSGFQWPEVDSNSDLTFPDLSVFLGRPNSAQSPAISTRRKLPRGNLFKLAIFRPFSSFESTELTVQKIRAVWRSQRSRERDRACEIQSPMAGGLLQNAISTA